MGKNLLAFAPNYVNVLEVNLELLKQYPELYSEFLTPNEKEILLIGEQTYKQCLFISSLVITCWRLNIFVAESREVDKSVLNCNFSLIF